MTDEQAQDVHSHSPLAEEAGRLLGVLQEWTRQTFPAAPQGAEGAAPVCQWCPVCQFMAVLRGERPEVTERVAEAGTAVASALRALAEAAGGAATGADKTRPQPGPGRVQRINLDAEDE